MGTVRGMCALAACTLAGHAAGDDVPEGMVLIKGGLVTLGTDDTKYNKNRDAEGPVRQTNVKDFYIDKTPVTNADFKRFTRETKYKTEAEQFGWSFVYDIFIAEDKWEEYERLEKQPWLAVPGAYWRMPEGKGSSIKEREDHPVVHISLADAMQYCQHNNKRLLFETEWEHAARGGSKKAYPWGKKPLGKDGSHMMNIWQGEFPKENTEEDGYKGTAPVDAFPENKYGVSSMLGNVWEWTRTLFSRGNQEKKEQPQFVLKGGSFVDSVDGAFNHKVRPSTRMGNTPDSGSYNTGFRCGMDGPQGPANEDKMRGPGGKEAMKDQEYIQHILAEEGVDGMKKYMKDLGFDGDLMTAGEAQKKQKKMAGEKKKMLEDMEDEYQYRKHHEGKEEL
eukprot:TRINITY_DN3006_c0_g3_i1.p1 TRINITY_DN3006_c0_g3~~TRINITY_DN3006_c0_g3_i1.p1  ORF type:complete len:391 (+),score=196.48 TRINITY_DN3006_c0_g3_i1:52-1224(+)